ncbi:MAG TPA: hypothetical protein DCW57_05395 [Planctomycetaceae bacterium]|nr:hypothetical protein [Planctomycetaceae bacterium]
MFSVSLVRKRLQGGDTMDPHEREAKAAIAEIQTFYGQVPFSEKRKDYRRRQKSLIRAVEKSCQELVPAGCHETVDELRGAA